MRKTPLLFIAAAMMAAAGTGAARAEQRPASGGLAAALGAAVDPGELAQQRARGVDGELLPLAVATLGGNTATGTTSGNASMDGSVTGNSGFTTVFQNTGNNVLFQSSTVVNITVR